MRFADAPDPMWELVLSVQLAQLRQVPDAFVPWRHLLARRLAEAGTARRAMAVLGVLVPPAGRCPDFLTPPQLVTDFDAGCEAVTLTPARRLRTDLDVVFTDRPVPHWVRDLANGDRRQIHQMIDAIRAGYSLLVAPEWSNVLRVVSFDRECRAEQTIRHGIGSVLATLPGVLGWDGRVLDIRYPVDRTVRLHGRGLTLLPSYFCWGSPITCIDPDLPPVLVYQAQHPTTPPQAPEGTPPPRLVALLGQTRTRCLRLLDTPHTTSQLAHDVQVSIGTASRHATALRDAGLITSVRQRNAVQHRITALGAALLAGGTPTR